MLFPDCSRIRWWAEAFGRTDDEMNGGLAPPIENGIGESALSGLETADRTVDGPGPEPFDTDDASSKPSTNGSSDLSSSFSSLGLGTKRHAFARMETTPSAREVEVEMQ